MLYQIDTILEHRSPSSNLNNYNLCKWTRGHLCTSLKKKTLCIVNLLPSALCKYTSTWKSVGNNNKRKPRSPCWQKGALHAVKGIWPQLKGLKGHQLFILMSLQFCKAKKQEADEMKLVLKSRKPKRPMYWSASRWFQTSQLSSMIECGRLP